MARVVAPGCWHHVTQRGNQQQTTFCDPGDREFYIRLLRRYSVRYGVRVAGFCLMGNHIHLLAIPAGADSLARTLSRLHNDYSRWLNLRHARTGHVWQNRFYSCPLDEGHQWEALRYVELNPVRAGLADRAEDWPWSSARAHLAGEDPSGLVDCSEWGQRWSPGLWKDCLAMGIGDACLLDRIREATRTGRPAGNLEFVQDLERRCGRVLQPGTPGRKPRATSAAR
jgi:putative transposase